jgi:hypothetical protein
MREIAVYLLRNDDESPFILNVYGESPSRFGTTPAGALIPGDNAERMRPTGGRFPYSTNVHGIAQAGPGCCAGDDDMRITLTVLVMLLLLPWTVQAQVATDFRNESLRDLITASSSEQHNPDWWQAMEDRLVQETAVPYDSVAEETLQSQASQLAEGERVRSPLGAH